METVTEQPVTEQPVTEQVASNASQDKPHQTRLVDVAINTPQDALQLIVTFLNLAQKRGSFTIDESAKIWECIKRFQ